MDIKGIVKCGYSGCGKLLSSKYNLKQHTDSCHNKTKPHICQICFKRFSSKLNKREHVRLIHSYSYDLAADSEIRPKEAPTLINIPMLTSLLHNSSDPDLRPFSKIEKLYLFSDLLEKIKLSTLKTDCNRASTLPKLSSLLNN